ncbi:MAG TPA: pyridoxal phosphate-dependent aminotransferase [Gammaproteobacteria bacterium]|nr:pyridoxal phosphate-dependent aminotransferase [Gammaproteobacteria bacterium]
MHLSKRVKRIKPSPTLAVTARAAALKAAGKDIIALGVGEPDFDTPAHIKQAAVTAINQGFTKYTAVDGITELKQAIINKFSRDNNLNYELNQILVSCGGKQSFYNLVQALLDPGDEVIIPAPYWVSYPDMVLLADGQPVIIETGIEQSYKITPEQLENVISERTRLFVINSPSNPTGSVYNQTELSALAEVLKGYPDIIIATDDMYEHIYWSDEPFCNIVMACPELYDRSIVLNGVSKAYAMTGWRIGYAAGPVDLVQAMKKIQSQSTSNPTSISQVAAQVALESSQDCIQIMLTEFKKRHDFVLKELNQIDGFKCLESQGTFYAFANVKAAIKAIKGIDNDVQLAEYFLEKADVALVPGSAFGAPGHLRLSFATSMDNLKKALFRIKKALNQ